jgi:preprotein translocase subunit SecG
MAFVFWTLLILFVLVCFIICFLVLIQSDKGGGISGTIGGGLGGASSLLGTQDTANILTRGTMIFGSAFFILCLIMSFVMSKQNLTAEKTLLQKRAEKQQDYSPASILDKGALPIKQAAEQTSQNDAQQAGLPITKPPAQSKALPVGAIPIGPPKK